MPDRPTVALNMVMSVDGRITIGEVVGRLTGPVDQALLHQLRAESDAVLVGAGTVRAQGYGRLLSQALQDQRRAEGRQAEPLLCVVSGHLNLSPDLALFHNPELRVLLATAAEGTIETEAHVEYLRAHTDEGLLDLSALLNRLHHEHGVRRVVCEGGASLGADLLQQGLCDEVMVTVSPRLVGGLGRCGVVSEELRREVGLELVSAASEQNWVFLRYRVESPA
jgi:riboflavin-specific deaminase-like protein